MHVVYFVDALYFGNSLPDLIDIQVMWGRLQDQDDALPESHPCSPEDDDGEDVGADGVEVPHAWPDKNDSRCNYHTH